MKVAILSESPADEAALRVLVEGVLRAPIEPVQSGLRARGWPNVAQLLPAVIRHLHFNTQADGLVVVVDADDSVVHTAAHEAPGYFHPQCRLCQLRAVFRQTTKKLPPARGRTGVLRLKWRVYGTDRPTLPHEIHCALNEVHRHHGDMRRLEADFPAGFGALARDLRGWQSQNS